MSKSEHAPNLQQPSRRDFVKASGLAATAAVATALPIARSAHAAGDDTIKIGMVGCGGRCTGAAVNAMNADPGVRLVAIGPDTIRLVTHKDVGDAEVEQALKAAAKLVPGTGYSTTSP